MHTEHIYDVLGIHKGVIVLYLIDKKGKQIEAFLSNEEDKESFYCHECGEKLVLSKDSKNLSTIITKKMKNNDYLSPDHPDYEKTLSSSTLGMLMTIEEFDEGRFLHDGLAFNGFDASEIYETDFAKDLDDEIRDIIINKWIKAQERKAEALMNIEDSYSGALIVFDESEIEEIVSLAKKSWNRRIKSAIKKGDKSEEEIDKLRASKELYLSILEDRLAVPNLVSKLFLQQYSLIRFTDHFSHAEIKPYGELRKCPLAESDWSQAHEMAKERVRQELSKIYKKKDGYTITGHYKVRDKETDKVLRWTDGAVLRYGEVVFVIEVEHKRISTGKFEEIQSLYLNQGLKCLWIPTIEFERENEKNFRMMISSIYTMMGRTSLIQQTDAKKNKYNAPKFMRELAFDDSDKGSIIFYSHKDDCFYFHNPEMKYVGNIKKEFSIYTNEKRFSKSMYISSLKTEKLRTPEGSFICDLYSDRSFIEIDFEDLRIEESPNIHNALILSPKENTAYLPPYQDNGVFDKLYLHRTYFDRYWKYMNSNERKSDLPQLSTLESLKDNIVKERNDQIAEAQKINERLQKMGGFKRLCSKYNIDIDQLTGQPVKVIKNSNISQRGDVVNFNIGNFNPDEISIDVSWKGNPFKRIKIKNIKEIVLENGFKIDISAFYKEITSIVNISVY